MRALRSLVKTTLLPATAGHVPFAAPDSCSGSDHAPLDRVAVKTFQRQSSARGSYQTARTTPPGVSASRGRWLIACGARATCSAGANPLPSDVVCRSETLAPEALRALVSQATCSTPLGSNTRLGCRSDAAGALL